MTQQTEDILGQLRAMSPELGRFKARNLRLFGSFARGDAGVSSDVDLLVDLEPGTGLFDLVRLGDFIEERLHRRVDLVLADSLRQELRSRVLAEALTV